MEPKKYIDADLLVAKIESLKKPGYDSLTLRMLHSLAVLVEDCPAEDVVPVVRCKDCKYALNDTEYCQEHNEIYCAFSDMIVAKKHFCGDGERKDEVSE